MKLVLVLVSIISVALASQPSQAQIKHTIEVFLNQTQKTLYNFTNDMANEQCAAASNQNLTIEDCFDYSFNYTKNIYTQFKPKAIKTINDAAHNVDVDETYFIIDEKSGNGTLKGNPAVEVKNAAAVNSNLLVSRLKKVLDDIISQNEGTGLKRRSRFSFLGKLFGKADVPSSQSVGSGRNPDIPREITIPNSGPQAPPPGFPNSGARPPNIQVNSPSSLEVPQVPPNRHSSGQAQHFFGDASTSGSNARPQSPGGSSSNAGSSSPGGSSSNARPQSPGGSSSNVGSSSPGGSASNVGSPSNARPQSPGGSSSNVGSSSPGGSSSNLGSPSNARPQSPGGSSSNVGSPSRVKEVHHHYYGRNPSSGTMSVLEAAKPKPSWIKQHAKKIIFAGVGLAAFYTFFGGSSESAPAFDEGSGQMPEFYDDPFATSFDSTADPFADPSVDPFAGSFTDPSVDPFAGSFTDPSADPFAGSFTDSSADPFAGSFTDSSADPFAGSFTDSSAGSSAASADTASANTASADTASADTASDDTASDDTASDTSSEASGDVSDGSTSDSSESQNPDIYDSATGYYWTFDTMVGQYYRIDDSTFEIIYYQG